MASNSSIIWTFKQNKKFENAIVMYGKGTSERWEKVAKAIGEGNTVEDVKKHYELLVEDTKLIESGKVPLPDKKPLDYGGASKGKLPTIDE